MGTCNLSKAKAGAADIRDHDGRLDWAWCGMPLYRSTEGGIDENFVRPIAPSKLLASFATASCFRTRLDPTAIDGHILANAGIEVNTNRHSVKRFGVSIHLWPIEFRLLQLQMENRGVQSRTTHRSWLARTSFR
ncbi:response regulator transcription factor [Sinorhizobium meliloti]|uniref:hypothetical protein n=1 Tax=Rhizobium meliloti TaxID=382 RepID=UPI001F3CDFC7|nr:hypothetical protein [Sinorhizobium meliloti]MCO6426215.1 hypothetical protein [Sinorhizobium meliloti]